MASVPPGVPSSGLPNTGGSSNRRRDVFDGGAHHDDDGSNLMEAILGDDKSRVVGSRGDHGRNGGNEMIKNSDHDRRSNRASEVEEYDGRMVWINAESSPQSVARSITGAAMPSARNGFPVYLFSKYDKNSNVAVKGIISAQHNLQERHATTISFKPTFRANRNELTFKVEKEGDEPEFKRNPSILDSVQQLSVASGTDPKVRMRVYAWMALFIKHLLWPAFSTL